jgi:hypothetical protein
MSASAQPWLHELVTALSAPTTILSERSGQIRPAGAQGVLHADARVLSAAVLEVGAVEPVPLSGGLLGAGRALFVAAARGLGDDGPDPTVRVERERVVGPGRVRERIRLISAATGPVATDITLRVTADLASIGEIKAGQPRPPAPIEVSAPVEGSAPVESPAPTEGPAGTRPAGAGAGPARLAWGAGALQVRLTAPGATVVAGAAGEALVRWPVRLDARGHL